MEKIIETTELDKRKPYVKPEILHELELETRAGTTNSLLDLFNPDKN